MKHVLLIIEMYTFLFIEMFACLPAQNDMSALSTGLILQVIVTHTQSSGHSNVARYCHGSAQLYCQM